jgi:tetratricopeptide (TPR) repeat protein
MRPVVERVLSVRAPDARTARILRVAAWACAFVLFALAAASYLLPWLGAREVERASTTWRADPEGAFERLERARALNFLSDRPDVIAGAIASRLGDRSRMREAFRRAIERNPHNWYAYLELALVEHLDGRRDAALRALARARALNPSEPVIRRVETRVRAGRPVSPSEIDRVFLQRFEARIQ